MALTIPIIAEYDGKNLDKAIKQFSQLEGAGAKSGFALKKAFVPAVAALGALTAGLGLATKAAMADEAAQVELARQLKATTQATDAQVKAAEAFITTLSRQTAMADDQLRPALANLVRATGSLELSQKAMAITADLATAKNIDMETASVAVAKALTGQTAALIKLDPSLKDLIDKSSSADDILKALNNTVGGAAEAFANTAEGGAKNFSIAMGELQESIGAVFLPLMTKMIPILNDVANYMAENTTVIIVLIGVVGSLAGAIVAANLAMRIYTGTAKVMQIANTLLANSFTSLQTSAGVLATGIGIAAITLQAFYELFREGPEAIRQTIQPFKDFARFTVATVATIGNGILDAVELVSRGINSMVNDAINAINFLNPTSFGEIPNVPMPNFPKIPVPNFGGGSYFPAPPAAVGSGAAREGGVGGVLAGLTSMPAMPSPAAPLAGGGGGGGGSQGPSFGAGLSYGGGVDVQGYNPFAGIDFSSIQPGVTINVAGGISTSTEIGKSVVDALTQYTQVYGPLNLAIR
jgi:hypothetical protein